MISATNLTSAGQFAGLTLIQAQASFMEMALTTLIINLRYALMSLSLAQNSILPYPDGKGDPISAIPMKFSPLPSVIPLSISGICWG
ncbi:MAG: AzlC family ABC transporter permease [Holdemania massiliensis]